jgi:syntaxin 16
MYYALFYSMVKCNPFRAGAVTVGLPPAWVDISEEISDDMQRVRMRMNELVKAHAKALRPIFGDNKGEQQIIESLTREITTQLKKCEKNLQRLSVGVETGEDANLRKNVQVRIGLFSVPLS